MTITALTDLSKMPTPSQDQATFDANFAYTLEQLPLRAQQENELAANLNAIAAGGAYAFPYVFDSATTDADPGVGKLRLGSLTQNASTVLRIDTSIVGGADITNVFADLAAGTSTVKGSIRLVKQGDASKWMTFDVTAVTSMTGYRNLTVTHRVGSAASPFALNDAILVYIERSGDKGNQGDAGGVVHLAAFTVSSAVANIDFLNIFSSLYDKYTIELQGMAQSASDGIRMQLAVAGALNTTSGYYGPAASGATMSGVTSFAIGPNVQTNLSATVEVRNANSGQKTVGARGSTIAATAGGFVLEGFHGTISGAVSGFRLFNNGGANFTGGTVRVFGHRNS